MKKQIGNFIVEGSGGDGGEYISVKTAAGDWSILFSIETAMYGFINMLIESNEEILHLLFLTWYESSVIIPDSNLLMEHRKSYDDYYERMPKEDDLSDEEDKKLVNELKKVKEANGG